MSTQAADQRAPNFVLREALILVGTLGGAYGISQFLRNSIGVIAPNLAEELHLSASEIGLLASLFFFSFSAAQIPLGLALDRYGPRRCMLFCAGVAVTGALLFAWAPSPGWLITARILLGLGASCYFMAPLALYAKRFPPDRFATVASFQYGLGTLGTLLATAPFACATGAQRHHIGGFVQLGRRGILGTRAQRPGLTRRSAFRSGLRGLRLRLRWVLVVGDLRSRSGETQRLVGGVHQRARAGASENLACQQSVLAGSRVADSSRRARRAGCVHALSLGAAQRAAMKRRPSAQCPRRSR